MYSIKMQNAFYQNVIECNGKTRINNLNALYKAVSHFLFPNVGLSVIKIGPDRGQLIHLKICLKKL